jgi:hypothetical protein
MWATMHKAAMRHNVTQCAHCTVAYAKLQVAALLTCLVARPARSSLPSAKMYAGANVPSDFFRALQATAEQSSVPMHCLQLT